MAKHLSLSQAYEALLLSSSQLPGGSDEVDMNDLRREASEADGELLRDEQLFMDQLARLVAAQKNPHSRPRATRLKADNWANWRPIQKPNTASVFGVPN